MKEIMKTKPLFATALNIFLFTKTKHRSIYPDHPHYLSIHRLFYLYIVLYYIGLVYALFPYVGCFISGLISLLRKSSSFDM